MTMTETSARSAAKPSAGVLGRAGAVTPSRSIAVVVLIALALLPFYTDSFTVSNFSMVLVYGIAILSLDVVTGYTGQVSLGHGGLMGLGAYSAALLVVDAGLNPYLALLVAPLAAAVLGLLFALSALRLSGMYLALATFALALTVPQFAKQFDGLTGGTQGMLLPALTSPVESLDTGQWTYFVILIAATISFVATRLFLGGRVGRALGSIRESELAATVCGVSIRNYKVVAFFVSSMLAGLAGALMALFMSYVSPDTFAFTLSLSLFVGLGVAGMRSMASPLVGGLIIVYLPLVSGEVYEGKPDIAYGAIIVVLVLLGRGGLIDITKSLIEHAQRLLPALARTGRAPRQQHHHSEG